MAAWDGTAWETQRREAARRGWVATSKEGLSGWQAGERQTTPSGRQQTIRHSGVAPQLHQRQRQRLPQRLSQRLRQAETARQVKSPSSKAIRPRAGAWAMQSRIPLQTEHPLPSPRSRGISIRRMSRRRLSPRQQAPLHRHRRVLLYRVEAEKRKARFPILPLLFFLLHTSQAQSAGKTLPVKAAQTSHCLLRRR